MRISNLRYIPNSNGVRWALWFTKGLVVLMLTFTASIHAPIVTPSLPNILKLKFENISIFIQQKRLPGQNQSTNNTWKTNILPVVLEGNRTGDNISRKSMYWAVGMKVSTLSQANVPKD